LKGFWVFPELELAAPDFARARPRGMREARRLAGPGVAAAGRLPRVRHRITIYDISLLPLRFTAAKGAALPKAARTEGWRWVSLKRLGTLPLASAEKRLLDSLRAALPARGGPRREGGTSPGLS
jgi:hypothetical protein